MPAMWTTWLTRRKQPSSSKRLLPQRQPIGNSSTKGEQYEKENKMKPTQSKPSIVFCHGIWADASCFNKSIPTLQPHPYSASPPPQPPAPPTPAFAPPH